MSSPKHKSQETDEILVQKLKDILLRQDREELQKIKSIFEDKTQLADHINPIIQGHIDLLLQKVPIAYHKTINQIIDARIKESKDEIIDAIYPVLGTLIQKYISYQFQMLKESIDDTIKNKFNRQSIWLKIKSYFTGINQSEIILNQKNNTKIFGVYVIQKKSGLLVGHAVRKKIVDEDLFAGMLTAIKSFAEDAFLIQSEELEVIEYANYKLYIQNLHTYYFVIAFDGTIVASDKQYLAEKIFNFSKKYLAKNDTNNIKELSKLLMTNFVHLV